MGVRSWSRRRAVVVGLVTAGLVLTAAVPPAASGGSGPLTVMKTDMPAGVDWYDIDNGGRIVGVTDGADGAEPRIVVWQRGRLTDIGPYEPPSRPDCPPIGWFCSPPGPRVPAINDRGTIATSLDGRAALWRDGEVTEVGGDLESSWVIALNERDQALVAGYTADRPVLALWTRGTFAHVADAPLGGSVPGWFAQLSDAGHVVVTALGPETYSVQAFVWHRGRRTDIGPISGLVNRRGQVAGSVNAFTAGESYPVLWEDGQVSRLPTLGGEQSGVQGINDRGQVVGYSEVAGEDGFETVLWDGGELVHIGADIPGPDSPVGINERGQVLIRANGENGRARAVLWDDGDLVALPPDHTPWASVEVRALNDRGQVYGRYFLAPFGPVQAAFWTVGRTPDSRVARVGE
jgi:uncharacterized membrane protein